MDLMDPRRKIHNSRLSSYYSYVQRAPRSHSLAQAADDDIMLELGDPVAVIRVTDRNEVHMHHAGPICAQVRLAEAVVLDGLSSPVHAQRGHEDHVYYRI